MMRRSRHTLCGGHIRTRRGPAMSQRTIIYVVGAIVLVIVIAYFFDLIGT